MLSEKPWRSEAVLRLGVSLILCILIGAAATSTARYFRASEHAINIWAFSGLVVASVASCVIAIFQLRRPWELEKFTRQFILHVFFIYMGMTFGAIAQHFVGKSDDSMTTLRAALTFLSFQGATLLLLPRFLGEHQETLGRAFGLGKNWKMAVLYGVLLAFAFLPAGELIQRGWGTLLKWMRGGVPPEVQTAVEVLKNSPAMGDRSIIAFFAIFLAPLGEEVLFRGILYPAVKRYGYPRLALWGTSLLFAAIHFNTFVFVPLFLFALLLTLLYEHTGNLLAPIAAHAVFNLLNFIRFLIMDAIHQQPPS